MSLTLREVADRLVDACKQGKEREALETLYAKDAISVEAVANPESGSAVVEGVENIQKKHEWWESEMEMKSSEIEGPFLHGSDRFAVIFKAEAVERKTGNSFSLQEVGVYTVIDGKISREEFFYTM